MANKPSISIVKGYHEVTPFPPTASTAHLMHRFAVILDTLGFVGVDYLPFQAATFFAIVQEISRLVAYDSMEVVAASQAEGEVGEELTFSSLEAFAPYLFDHPDEDQEPPLRILFKAGDQLTCLEESEFWACCGGPYPYSDSYTLSFFTREDMAEAFQAACLAACEHAGVDVN